MCGSAIVTLAFFHNDLCNGYFPSVFSVVVDDYALPHIPKGVTILPNILGCVERLRYTNYGVVDKDKFPEFEPQVYMENKGTSTVRVSILETK